MNSRPADTEADDGGIMRERYVAPKRRIICQAVWRPGEPWPYCMCQQRSLPGEDYCAKHMPDRGERETGG